MRRTIRGQILFPIVAIQAVAVLATSLTTATLAARRGERQVVDRLAGVVETLGRSNFPYTPSVLAAMRGLSGAEFVAYDAEGEVRATSFDRLREKPPERAAISDAGRLESLGASPTVTLDGESYLAVPMRPASGPRSGSLLVLYPVSSWRQARWEAAAPSLALGLASLALMVGATSLTAHHISRRIRGVEGGVARVAAGDFAPIDPGPIRDEVQDLANSVNVMCGELDRLASTIRQTERERLLAQLGAGLAHQLRNSLTGARMSVQLHARRYPAPPDDRTLEVALRQLAMTEEQVKGLLSLGRNEPRAAEPCRLDDLLDDVALLVRPACEHSKVDFAVEPIEDGAVVMADASGLRAAVLNLTLNAIEAAGRGGIVRLWVEGGGAMATVHVADSGSGPPLELSAELFEPFATSKPEGVGLGLALARRVATEGGGRLSWERSDGRTLFRLELPRVESLVNP